MVKDYAGRIAVLGVTNEEVGKSQVVIFKSNVTDEALPNLHKIPTHEMCEARHGAPFSSATAKVSLLYPYREDSLGKVRVNGHIVELFKVTKCNDIFFSLKENEIYQPLTREVIALAKDRLVMPERKKVRRSILSMFRGKHYERKVTAWDRKGEIEMVPVILDTPCRLIFSEKHDPVTKKIVTRHIDHEIGKPIEERFGLEQLGISCGLSSHRFRLPNKEAKDAFYQKYPHTHRESDEFTLHRLCTMMYDLVRIRHGHLPLK